MIHPQVAKIAQTLCFASRVGQEAMECPFCENGRCHKTMWESFLPEAQAVWNMLSAAGLINKPPQKLLPGLGGR